MEPNVAMKTSVGVDLSKEPVTLESISKLMDQKLSPDSTFMLNLCSALRKDLEATCGGYRFDSDIEARASACRLQLDAPPKHTPYVWPSEPWTRLHVDFLQYQGTQREPVVALLGRRLRMRLDLLRANPTVAVEAAQAKQVIHARGMHREVQPAEQILFRNYSRNNLKWMEGQVSERTGAVTYK
ncbi:hypothetical protein HF086_014749, partial [Spodoptera exigua]